MSKQSNGNGNRTTWALVSVILLLAGLLIGTVVDTARGFGDLRCDVTENRTRLELLAQQVEELKSMRGTVNRIAIRLGVEPEEGEP